ncbi:MAG: response regulator [Sphaerobacter sp.]|nr:response regulator [Sphaerobacter sp.]
MSRILVVEDDPTLAALLGEYLAELGYVVEVVPDGEQAVERAIAAPPDLVVMDLMMPRLNGGEASRILRRHPRTASVPIVAISALHDARELRDVLPIDVLVPKPFDLADLARVVTALAPPGPGQPREQGAVRPDRVRQAPPHRE